MTYFKRVITRNLPKSGFLRGVSLLIGGTLSAQVLMIVFSPLLTRLYSPEDFGLLAIYSSVLSIGILLASLRYDVAIPLPEEDDEAVSIVALSLIIVLTVSILAFFVVFFWGKDIAELLQFPELERYILLLPIGLLIAGAYNVLTQWNVRQKKFGLIASTKLRQAVVTIAIQLMAFKWNGLALILSQISSNSAGVTRLSRPNFQGICFDKILNVAMRYRRFPKYSAPAGLARVAGVELPALLLAASFNPAAAGLYALTNRVLGVPANVLGSAVSQVFTSNAAEAYRSGKLGDLVRKLYSQMSVIGLPFMLILMLIGPDLFGFIFGETWRQSGEFARWMAPWLYLVFVSSPITTVTAIMEKQKQGLIFHLTLLLVRIVSLSVGIYFEDLMLTIILLALVNALWRFGFLMWIYIISGNKMKGFVLDSSNALFSSLLCVVPILMSKMFGAYLVFSLLVSLVLVSLQYWKLFKEAN
ncbi:lipopolysaccharide biosynthesis protein [Vibrio fluminensis]|uniref:lipopolysaccharide biosynthesis protein n=1 Tax=Vibrio fluminensis TaxID=2783614 RepID=UPI0018873DEE|nr:oligosaccharide flippase family protein [Vibrio fluminensis]